MSWLRQTAKSQAAGTGGISMNESPALQDQLAQNGNVQFQGWLFSIFERLANRQKMLDLQKEIIAESHDRKVFRDSFKTRATPFTGNTNILLGISLK